VTIGPARGRFPGAPATRSWEVEFIDAAPPQRVTLDGQVLDAWNYDAARRTLTVDTGRVSTTAKTTIQVATL
jgi:hypothetical protein